MLFASVLWVTSLIIIVGGPGRMSMVGVLNTPDFVHFYTVGRMAADHRIREAYDWERLHAEQIALVPESAELIYPPVYPPQAAVLLMPFSRLSFESAAILWTIFTVAGYAVAVWLAWFAVRQWLPDRTLVFSAAAGFPPFWQLVMNGQITIVIILACLLGWMALQRGRHFWAGVALGILAVKPQFGLVFAVVALAKRDWRMICGAITSVAIQAGLVWSVLGSDAFAGFWASLPTIVAHADELEAKPFQSHSIRSLTRLLPAYVGGPLWITSVAVVLWRTATVWLTDTPLTLRFGTVLLAAVLVNPHLIVYDAALLACPLMWLGAFFSQRSSSAADRQHATIGVATFGMVVYGLFIAFIAPSAALVRVQASVLVMLWLFWRVDRTATSIRTTWSPE